jgi:hypothetical protein
MMLSLNKTRRHDMNDLNPCGQRRDFLKALAAVTGSLPLWAQAQSSWPSKPVNLIVPFPAGGGTDAFARPMSAQFAKLTGKQLIIDNRGGAGGTLGAGIAAKAVPDGYNLFMGAVHHTIAPSMYPRLDYDLERDLVPLIQVASVPQVLVVNPKKVQAADFKAFRDLVKKEPRATELWLRWGRHLAPLGGRVVQAADPNLHHAHSLPGCWPGPARPDCRQRGHDVRRTGFFGSTHQGRSH